MQEKPKRPVPRWQVVYPGPLDCSICVSAWTKGEARAELRRLLKLDWLPDGVKLVRVSEVPGAK